MRTFAFLSILPFLAAVFLALPPGPSRPPAEACTDCHSGLLAGRFVHEAATDGCEMCHESNGQAHPQEGVKGFALSAPVPDLCVNCHDRHNNKTTVHAPVAAGECTACHSPHSGAARGFLADSLPGALCQTCHEVSPATLKAGHKPVQEGLCASCHDPHQTDTKNLLREEGNTLCMGCHQAEQKDLSLATVHPPFSNKCIICHTAHGSSVTGMLKDPVTDLCFGCHDDIQYEMEEQAVTHKPLTEGKACMACHSPHATDGGKLLLREEMDLCFSCHDRVIKSEGRTIQNIKQHLQKSRSIHPPIESDGCVVCHPPHSGKAGLLKEAFPTASYVPVSRDTFALCFTCHNPGIIEAPKTTTATNFRDGDKNLHQLHIKGKKGRNCTMCHDIHGSNNQHLIREKTPFSSWEMEMVYTTTENGGSCYPGCHSEKTYKR